MLDKQIIISVKSILFLALLILGGYAVYRLSTVLGIFLVASLIVISMENSVKRLMKQTVFGKKVPRSVAVIVSYFILVLILAAILTVGLPPIVNEAQKLIVSLPKLVNKLPLPDNFHLSFESFIPQFSTISNKALTLTLDIFSNITTVFSTLMLSIYMSLDWENIKNKFISMFKAPEQKLVQGIFDDVEFTIGTWIKGESLLMLIIGTVSYLGLTLLGVEYPLALGLISGLLEAVPVVGPVFSAVVAAIIAFSASPAKGLAVILMYVVIQQLENNLLVPRIMGKVTGYGPLVVLCVFMVASNFFGLIGAVLAMPVFMTIMIVTKRLLQYSAQK